MAMFRFRGGVSFDLTPSMYNSPADIGIIPAMRFNIVVFPHPDVPRRTMNSPFSTKKEISLR